MNIKELLNIGTKTLIDNNVEYGREDALDLLSNILKKDRLYLIINGLDEVDKESEDIFFNFIEERGRKRPLQYILGNATFMELSFKVKEGVLIPRADTEILVEEVLNYIDKNNYKDICDVCTGTGAIGIAIGYHRPTTTIDICDISEIAEEIAKENIFKLKVEKNVEFYRSDLLSFAEGLHKKYDVIVSNPPYIRTSVIEALMEDVKNYEPHLALDGGEDGLIFYRKITKDSCKFLNKGGLLAFEIGYDQGEEVSELLKEYGFIDVIVKKDLGNNDRVVLGRYL
ncbi:peptide chain release factor N(5)-glutamine methyltransferase [Clostridium cellulovorans]|uniref:Release factor glutamine methyltransferase n=1 Tax=Clostridium cellulovorans (strain ATCC 35296 / DSM 3052 / OCM 3 / 743B) TaxID=573061 RepID=D9STM4_CLOC7|nr:peptide chain release factor N(5)-glutamine methyltransferase [Clostridium cellulovorans]ADL52758.1 protein-(glutamine-N5) methyltransferase, release factor-specific [Clostridium cellulovorans 743B]